MSEFIVLDVGHGNSALLRDKGVVAVIDAPTRAILLDTLDDLEIDLVHAAFISHADRDHIAGILALLTSDRVRVENVFVNPDAQKKSRVWRDFRAAVSVAERKGTCVVRTSLTSTEPGTVPIGDVKVTVVAPSAALALTGVGGKTTDGRPVTANSLSAVLRISQDSAGAALLAADIDDVGLDDAMTHGADLSADVLVFPHHGGLPGGDISAFAGKLLGQVGPKTVIFSNGRSRHDNPRQEIVTAAVSAGCAVACTQLSERCSAGAIEGGTAHLERIRAAGREFDSSCAGSMTIVLEGGAHRHLDAAEGHAAFIAANVPTPMCRVYSRETPTNSD